MVLVNSWRDASLLLPQVLDGRRARRERLGELADGTVGEAENDAVAAAGCLDRLGGLHRAAFRRVGPVLVAIGAVEAGRPADHARRQRVGRIGTAGTDEFRGDSYGSHDGCGLSTGRKQAAPRHADQI